MWRRARCALCARSGSTDHEGLARRSKGIRTVVLRPAPVAVVVGAAWRAVTAFGCAAPYLRVERALRVQVA